MNGGDLAHLVADSLNLGIHQAVGNATGWQNWQADGKAEHASGEAEITAAQAKNYVEGASDRVQGTHRMLWIGSDQKVIVNCDVI